MTTKIKIIVFLSILNIVLFKWLVPAWCIIQIIIGIGDQNFYSIFANNIIYIMLSLIVEVFAIPTLFLSTQDKQWISDKADRIKNKNKDGE